MGNCLRKSDRLKALTKVPVESKEESVVNDASVKCSEERTVDLPVENVETKPASTPSETAVKDETK